MNYRHKVFTHKNPYDLNPTESFFINAMQSNCLFQYSSCPEYRTLLDSMHFCPTTLTHLGALSQLPFIPTLFFKSHSLSSIPPSKSLIKATSSGTKGNVSYIHFDIRSMYYALRMTLSLASYHNLLSPIPTNYLVLGYQPHRKNATGVSKTAYGATLFAPAIKRTYALRYTSDGYKLDLDNLIVSLIYYSKQPFPVRLMGFPSYTFFLLEKMKLQGIKLHLKKGSKILLAGGWKQFYTEKVEKEVLFHLIEDVLGITPKNVHEFFGAVEHPIMYCTCPNHHFHIPIYSRVIIRDIHTLTPLPFGKVGLVNLLTPMIHSMPLLSTMTDDLGILHSGEKCGCGITAPYLEIIGRVGVHAIKTCATSASELLKGVTL